MAKKGRKQLAFQVGRIGRFLKTKKKKPAVKKEKPFVGYIPPACLQTILRICHLMGLEIAKKEAYRMMGMEMRA